jgi:hypothetical protein
MLSSAGRAFAAQQVHAHPLQPIWNCRHQGSKGLHMSAYHRQKGPTPAYLAALVHYGTVIVFESTGFVVILIKLASRSSPVRAGMTRDHLACLNKYSQALARKRR